jgi:hypothetical protein
LWDLTSDFHRGAKFEIGVLYTEFVGISMIWLHTKLQIAASVARFLHVKLKTK